jgi:pSer/pThr/pTyr-binding forkhead associated (FHA) protein
VSGAGEIWLTLSDGSAVELREAVNIGRDNGNELVFPSPTVSRRHARVAFREGRWWIEDRGSFNGTFLNGVRLQPGLPTPLRHADSISIGTENVVFSWPAQVLDPEQTQEVEELGTGAAELSPLQKQVLDCLCAPWLAGAPADALPSNSEIARQLGTPEATETVKAALRRIYAKAGLAQEPSQSKRRAICQVARQRGWI